MRRIGALGILFVANHAHAECDDVALTRVAQKLAETKAKGAALPDELGLASMLRAEGDAHVWPRAWITKDADRSRMLEWNDAWKRTHGRCGVAIVQGASAIVSIDALADFETSLPSKARIGTWLTIEARVPASAKVYVQSDGGSPHAILSSYDGTRVRARAMPEKPGTMTIQIVAELASGPRPVLEWRVQVEAPQSNDVAPGESAAGGTPEESIAKMLGALRSELSLRPLARDVALDAAARAHVMRMMQAGSVAHDVGDGPPIDRVQNTHIVEAGENVAHAASAVLAHRALWASPSHRQNLMRADWDRVGIAAVSASDGTVWVTQIFAR